MIEYFTALVLHYEVQDLEMETVVWFENEAQCQSVMDQDIAMPLYDELYSLYGNNIMMFCEVTDKPSRVVRPRLRPEGLGNG